MQRLPLISLILANLVVASAVLSQQWGYYYVLLIYWLEAVIIGFYGLGRMCTVCWFGEPFGTRVGVAGGLSRVMLSIFLGGFFIAKFGGFALGTGFWVTLTPSLLASEGGASGEFMQIAEGLEAVGGGVLFAAAILFLSHGISFVTNFIGRDEYKRSNAIVLLFKPYLRMALIVVVLVAGFATAVAVPGLSRTTTFVIAIVLLKLVADVVSHLWEHRRRAPVKAPTPA
ncbi:MAG: DUF6498-containing protein [Rubricoccaceae bacterium]|nr:DUF6498-containing protein [Rubricoccaceae bacterium]